MTSEPGGNARLEGADNSPSPTPEVIGQFLLKLDRDLATSADLDTLLRLVSRRGLFVPGPSGRRDSEETRSNNLLAIAEYIHDLKAKHGTLEAAVAGGYARGLVNFVRWRAQDQAKKRNRKKRGRGFQHILFDDDPSHGSEHETGNQATAHLIARQGSGVRLDGRYVRAEEDEIIERVDEERRRARLLARVEEVLGPEDYEVWRLVEEGHTNQQIAEKLGFASEGTVRYRRKRIERKLRPGVRSGTG